MSATIYGFQGFWFRTGLKHLVPLFPQPTGNESISIEVFTVVINNGMFTLVKAVELLVGLVVLAFPCAILAIELARATMRKT